MIYQQKHEIRNFLVENRQVFEEKLLNEAKNVREKIEDIRRIGNIDLVANAHILALHVVDQKERELVDFATKEGEAWAKFSLTLALKLEWVQAIRRTLWNFLQKYYQLHVQNDNRDEFFDMEKKINVQIDQFLQAFFLRYTKFKDELIESQRSLVENLSVPIIPITPLTSVLPLIGAVDSFRIKTIEEKVLLEIGRLRIRNLTIDLSGVAEMEEDVISHFLKIIDGIQMMGCKPIITGIRPQLVKKMIHKGLSFGNKAETLGTLQQALQTYMVPN